MFKKIPYGLAALTVMKVDKAHSVQLQQHQQKWNADLSDKMNVQLEHKHHHKRHHHHQLAQSIPACNSIECKTETAAPNKLQKDQDPWDKDYPVPNFGVDRDILDSQSNSRNAAAACAAGQHCGQPWVVAAQQEHESIPACNSIECKTETAAAAKLQKDTDPWDKDYFVPNFGVDRDIVTTHQNAANARTYCSGKDARCGQQWQVAAQKASIPACNSIECKTETAAAAKLQKDTDPWDKDYFIPNFGVDHDILDTHSNRANAEAFCKGGKCGQQWVVAAQKNSIPACNSIECKTGSAADGPPDKLPRDYFVPNFGLDHDIITTHNNDKNAKAYCGGDGARCGQPWYVAAQKDSLSVPACTSLGCATGTSAKGEEDTGGARGGDQLIDALKVQTSSIPACTSIECKVETAAPNKLQKDQDPWDKDYPVPNFGVDKDILDSHASDKLAAGYCAGGAAKCGQPWVVAAQQASDSDSRPACTSFECQSGTAAPKVATPLWAVHYEPEKGKEQVQLQDWIPDEDEIDSYRHMNLNEHQDYSNLNQIGSNKKSIPACNSIECKTGSAADGPPDKLPRDYFVPNFGLDHDILDTWAHDKYAKGYCAQGDARCGQQWNVAAQVSSKSDTNKSTEQKSDPTCTSVDCEGGRDSIGKDYHRYWENVNWNAHYLQLDSEIKSDPICNSAGCTQYLHPDSKDDHPMNYPVPNFGLDSDILDSGRHMKNAQAAYGVGTFNSTKIPPEAYDAEFELVQFPTPFQPEPNTDPHFCDNNGFCAGAQGPHPQPVIQPSLAQQATLAPPHCNKTGFCGEGVGPHRAPDAMTGSKPAYTLAQGEAPPHCNKTGFCGEGVGPHRAPDAMTGSKPAYTLAQGEAPPHCNKTGFCGEGVGPHRAPDSMTGSKPAYTLAQAPPHCNKTGFCGEGVGPHRAPDAMTGSKPAYTLTQVTSDPAVSSSGWIGPYEDEPLKELHKLKYPAYLTGNPLDHDIIETQKHQAAAEIEHGALEDPRPWIQYYH